MESQSRIIDSMSQYGTAMPYLALFNEEGLPIMNTITGIPLGAYISKFSYKYEQNKEDQCSITFDTGDPDTVDIAELQEHKVIMVQWGYIYPDGSYLSGPVRMVEVKDFNAIFDDSGTHATIKCKDSSSVLRGLPPHRPSAEDDDNDGVSSMVDYLNRGCDRQVGVIIEKFSYR